MLGAYYVITPLSFKKKTYAVVIARHIRNAFCDVLFVLFFRISVVKQAQVDERHNSISAI